ncbi:DNA circularization N-terminal domain-containing protein [Achromobacter seleniivolatilans]|uniref:DNA circularization N-terminal domain-containing protein n=1 Tax=Achromobacter seleniivolatilans TaxID=3047478 RepID=A0ABY9M946_9BURK|nr:DNA circularization N-terminal domain-containing protein [Achromobacter sp. R39]WMD23104.1 DNA circularization N-terminal domain-containing protein [Achromobacter sp. R39]
MSWDKTLLDASFKGIKFECEHTQDGAERDVQKHQYPYLNGEDAEDLGRGGIGTELTAVFWGDDYEQKLQKFVEVLEQPGPGELIHPIFGSIPLAQLEGWRIRHDAESPDACSVELRFLHSTTSSPFFVRQLPEQKAAASRQLKDDGIASGVEAFAKRLKALTSLQGITDRLNSIRSTMGRVLSAVRSVTNGTSAIVDLIDFPRAFTAELSNGLHGLVDLRAFGSASRMSDWKGLKGIFDDVVLLPVSSAKGQTPTSFRPTQTGQAATQQGQNPIAILPEDQKPIEAIVKVVVAGELVDIASDILTEEAKRPTLSPADIEQIVADVRDAIQDAIDDNRDLYPVEEARVITEPLKEAALAIQEAGAAVIEARPPLRRRTIDAPANLHLIAFAWYGDFRRSDELLRLNPRLRNPNDLNTGDTINGYAQ